MPRKVAAARKGGGAQLRASKGAWTLARRKRFLAELAETMNVSASVRALGLSAQGVYKLKRRDAAFSAAWDQTIVEAYGRVELTLLERALMGEGDCEAAAGGKKRELEKLSERALLALLAHHKQTVRDVRVARERERGERLMQDESSARERLREKLDEIEQRLRSDDED